MKFGPRHVHGSFKNGGIEFRATFADFEAEHAWITVYDVLSRFEVILSGIHASQVGDS